MQETNDLKIERERDFHNEAFENASRRSVSKYYRAASKAWEYYHSRLIGNSRGTRVLEIGCGTGDVAIELANVGAHVSAIDVSDFGIEQAKRMAESKGLKIDFQRMDAENLSFENEVFDLVCGSGILHHLDLQKSLSEISRVLKPTGIAIFYEPLGGNPVINLFRRLTPRLRTEDEHPLLMRDLRLLDSYFNHVEIHFFNFLSLLAIGVLPFPFFRLVLNILDALDVFVFRFLRFTRRFAWIVVIELHQ